MLGLFTEFWPILGTAFRNARTVSYKGRLPEIKEQIIDMALNPTTSLE